MSQAIVTSNDHGTDTAVLPEVNIGTAYARCSNMNETVIRSNLWDFAFYQTEVVVRVGLYGVVDGLLLEDVHDVSCLERSSGFTLSIIYCQPLLLSIYISIGTCAGSCGIFPPFSQVAVIVSILFS